jgi:hypothetical protein
MSSEEVCDSDSDGDKRTQDEAQHHPGNSRQTNTATPAIALSTVAVSEVTVSEATVSEVTVSAVDMAVSS